jgi:hypothetical protein
MFSFDSDGIFLGENTWRVKEREIVSGSVP